MGSQFKSTDMYNRLKIHLLDCMQNREISGWEAVTVVDSYLLAHRDHFKAAVINRENAIKVLDMFLRDSVIRPTIRPADGSPPLFEDSKKVFYRFNSPELHRVVLAPLSTNPPDSAQKQKSPKIVRKGSLKSLLSSPLLRRSGSRCKSADERPYIQSDSSDEALLSEEARLYEASLVRLLSIVELPVLDDVLDLKSTENSANKSMGIITSILSKMGLWQDDRADIFLREDMESLFTTDDRIKPLAKLFRAARECAPSLRLDGGGKEDQVGIWAKHALNTVRARYDSYTKGGLSPLIPNEFVAILDAISHQLLQSHSQITRLHQALTYLFFMIPSTLRHHLVLLLNFLKHTNGTNLWFSFCGSNCDKAVCGSMDMDDNGQHAIGSLRQYIFPHHLPPLYQTQLLIHLINLLPSLGTMPDVLREDVKEGKRASELSIRYASSSVAFNVDDELAKNLVAILADTRTSEREKMNKVQLFQANHPTAYSLYRQKYM